ncbi:hypothetical protein C8Q78DRAFT_679036 [Trametes maxima]|nr:hypothetical protein C8Q78DRAFT_679036 [Trametes maxima]
MRRSYSLCTRTNHDLASRPPGRKLPKGRHSHMVCLCCDGERLSLTPITLLSATTVARKAMSLAIVPRRPRRKLATSAARRATFPASALKTRTPPLVVSARSTAVLVTRAPSATAAARLGILLVHAPRHLEVLVGTAVGTAPLVAASNVPGKQPCTL